MSARVAWLGAPFLLVGLVILVYASLTPSFQTVEFLVGLLFGGAGGVMVLAPWYFRPSKGGMRPRYEEDPTTILGMALFWNLLMATLWSVFGAQLDFGEPAILYGLGGMTLMGIFLACKAARPGVLLLQTFRCRLRVNQPVPRGADVPWELKGGIRPRAVELVLITESWTSYEEGYDWGKSGEEVIPLAGEERRGTLRIPEEAPASGVTDAHRYSWILRVRMGLGTFHFPLVCV